MKLLQIVLKKHRGDVLKLILRAIKTAARKEDDTRRRKAKVLVKHISTRFPIFRDGGSDSRGDRSTSDGAELGLEYIVFIFLSLLAIKIMHNINDSIRLPGT
jgi:hypothetical protein